MKLNNLVAQIVVAPNFDHFSTVEVRSAYLALNEDKSIDPNDARRFVYTELLKLVNKGWLKKSVSKKKEITSFIKTEMFEPDAIDVNPNVDMANNEKALFEATDCLNETLVNRLNNYKNELITGLGEAEEYKRLCEQFPKLKSTLQPRYNEVREHNSKLLGSIKAVENLI
ncbi:hypothetical protein [Colwellia psychrerythraea]|uniref:Uncharacterized protein n=1 Tax=Colwellia psychrerythraea TaxID=28229 RepID=A0A099KFV7_COLPS|nr:hypothetical protein [Colwellia psychrerythraea]KGJ89619.1 hypothetical protein ND2E_3810 [Colwellia psychrerythraea]